MEAQQTATTQPSLTELEERLEQLPMLPSVVCRLMALDRRSDDFFDDILKLGREDPPFAAKLIQFANSAAQHPASPITSIPNAVARLGTDAIARLITTMAVVQVFVPTTDAQRALWLHSIETAVTAQRIATQGSPGADPENAYLAGLLHDIGRFVLFQMMTNELNLVEESDWQSVTDLVAAERRICGFDHSQLGYHACRKWRLPDAITDVVRLHHKYASAQRGVSAGTAQLIPVVQMADCFSVVVLRQDDLDEMDHEQRCEVISRQCVHSSWNDAPIPPASLAAQVDQIREQVRYLVGDLGL